MKSQFSGKVEEGCACFKRSGEPKIKVYETQEKAYQGAFDWVEEMNIAFCQKHLFEVFAHEQNFIIKRKSNK